MTIETSNDYDRQDRENSIFWAGEFLKKNDWAVMGFCPIGLFAGAEICEIAVVTADNEVGWQSLIKPSLPASWEGMEEAGISPDRFDNAPTIDQVFLELLRVVGFRKIAVWNAAFQLRVLQSSLQHKGLFINFKGRGNDETRYWLSGKPVHNIEQRIRGFKGFYHERLEQLPQHYENSPDTIALIDCQVSLATIRKIAAMV